MQRQSESTDQESYREGVLNSRAYLSHYRHIKAGYNRMSGCGFCEQGVDALVTEHEFLVSDGSLVVADPGSDQEGTASHSSGDGEPSGEDAEQLQRKTPWWQAQS